MIQQILEPWTHTALRSCGGRKSSSPGSLAGVAFLKTWISKTQPPAQVGRYYAKTKFGCITHCDSADFNGIDGILGLGMPDAALASIPEPLFFALSDETGDPANQVRIGVAIQLM